MATEPHAPGPQNADAPAREDSVLASGAELSPVASPPNNWTLWAGLAGAVTLGGVVLFSMLSAQARQRDALAGITGTAPAAGAPATAQAALPEAPELFPPSPPPPPPFMMAQQPPSWTPSEPSPPPPSPPPPPPPPPPPQPEIRYIPQPQPIPPPPPPVPEEPQRPTSDQTQRLRSPALVVDLSTAPPAAVASPEAAAAAAGGAGNGQDAFFARVSSTEAPVVRAGTVRNPQYLVPQGAMISAVLETAINSDLPGFVRAVVSQDVRGFDGRTVLIPRGSRLIGQYQSEVALGQSRAFVVWTRLIRTDGVSVQLASPGTDPLGRAGLTGQVDRHFWQRYGPGLLTTVLSAGLSNTGSSQVVIGTAQSAGAGLQVEPVKPTVTVAQGSAIQVFVARDLDFSAVAAPAPAAPGRNR